LKLYHGNVIDEATLTASSARSGFPVINLQHPHLSRVWRSDTASGEYVIADAGVGNTLDFDVAAVLAHNLTGAATLTVKADNLGDWVTPAVSETLDPTQTIPLKEIVGSSYRFARIDADDPTNPWGYIEIGRLWASPRIVVLPSMLVNFQVPLHNSDVKKYSITRQKFTNIGTTWREFELEFPPTEYALIEQLRQLYVESRDKSLIMACVDVDDWELIKPVYCSLKDELVPKHYSQSKWTWALTLEEDK
jgi:hypothetical protein